MRLASFWKRIAASAAGAVGRLPRPSANGTVNALLALAGCVILLIIHERVYAFFMNLDSHKARAEELRFAAIPAWAKGKLPVAFGFERTLPERLNLAEPEALARVAEWYGSNPWVRSVDRLERTTEGGLRATVTIRRPLLAVAVSGEPGSAERTWALVDTQGVRLPGLYRTPPRLAIPVYAVLGAPGAPPRAGERWTDARVAAAVEVGRAWIESGLAEKADLQAIDTANLDGSVDPTASDVVLVGPGGVRIDWGRPAFRRRPGELPVAVKIAHVRKAAEAYPGLRGLAKVDVRFYADRFTVTPIASRLGAGGR